MCGKNKSCMIDKNSAIGILPQMMVRARVIMMVRDDMLDHTPFIVYVSHLKLQLILDKRLTNILLTRKSDIRS